MLPGARSELVMGLREYRRKRDFTRTPEPAGSEGRSRTEKRLGYVIQAHAARRLHYDFRLELDGVLKSWAVPKGPSLDPQAKRLAVEVEDHPIEYGDFEGVIPRGESGGGTVMLWDRGWWEPIGDAGEGYAKGNLKFILHGEKLQGRWALVRMARRERDKSDNWLLIKERDERAEPGSTDAIVTRETRSAATGREMRTIAADADRVWSSKTGEVTTKGPKATRHTVPANPLPFDLSRLAGAKRAKAAPEISPQLAAAATIRFSEHQIGQGTEFFAAACQYGLEGMVSKRCAALYRPGRGSDWVKVKAGKREDLVVVAFTDPAGARSGLGALLVAYHTS